MATSSLKQATVLVAACVLVAASALTAQAAIISADSSFGTDTLTLDTDSGLQWLDVTLSTAYSYDGVLLELAPGGIFEDYRLATGDEVLELWGNAGINVGAGFLGAWTSENFLPVVDLMNQVGVTGPNQGNMGDGNFYDYTAGHIESGPGGGSVMVAVLGADPDPTVQGRVHFGSVPSSNTNQAHGAWLVGSPIPEPSAALLFGIGALVVAPAIRRSKT